MRHGGGNLKKGVAMTLRDLSVACRDRDGQLALFLAYFAQTQEQCLT
jgi:hypothetical protein